MKNNTSIAVVVNFKYARRHLNRFVDQLRNVGKYDGEILIITGMYTPISFFQSVKTDKNINILRFPKIVLSSNSKKRLSETKFNDQPNRYKRKKFQWHKLHLFDKKLKKWDFIFYLDVNMTIHFDINPLLDLSEEKKFLARADSYPEYKKILSSQFDKTTREFKNLETTYNLNINNYFQTGLMFYDTNLISSSTKKEILDLVEKYPVSVTNEQGILNLYFIFIKNCYKEFPEDVNNRLTYFYWMVKDKEIIITKQNVEKYK
tara:strand:+ start:229 stop:1011 length:783 start_codon:yes stop_codon:yes gene_type:complete